MTIREVSERYGLSADTLRYYERVGLIPPVPRTGGGVRDYDGASLGWVELIKCMRSAGVGIEALTEYCRLFQQGEETLEARKALLVEQRTRRSRTTTGTWPGRSGSSGAAKSRPDPGTRPGTRPPPGPRLPPPPAERPRPGRPRTKPHRPPGPGGRRSWTPP